jgi:hypothetical protein
MAQEQQQAGPVLYLKYKFFGDFLKIILFSSQSPLGALPMLYHIGKDDKHVFFIQTGGVGSTTIHYHVQDDKPDKKFVELKRLSGDFNFVDKIGTDSMSLYIPILELERSSFDFI